MTEQAPKEFGEYRVVRRIGKGGFGAVYLAENRLFPKHLFAVKVFNRTEEEDGAASQYLDELNNVIRLAHSNIVQVRGFGIEERSGIAEPYIVMDYIEGPNGGSYNLKQHLRARGDVLSPAETKRIFRQILEALAVVHEKRIAHLDLKPENILLDAELNAYVSDFGVSRTVSSKSILLKDGPPIHGFSPYYASPEQIRHAYGSRHSDIFSLGVMMVECLTGSRPEIVHSKTQPRIELISLAQRGLDPVWDTLLEHCLSIDPAYRFPNASVFLRALRQIPTSDTDRNPVSQTVPESSSDSSVEITPPTSRGGTPRPSPPSPVSSSLARPSGRMAQLLEISEKKLREKAVSEEHPPAPKKKRGVLYQLSLVFGVVVGLALGGLVGLNLGDTVGGHFSATLGSWASWVGGVNVGSWVGVKAGEFLGAVLGGVGGCLVGYAGVAGLARWRDTVARSPLEEEEEEEISDPSA